MPQFNRPWKVKLEKLTVRFGYHDSVLSPIRVNFDTQPPSTTLLAWHTLFGGLEL
ncbi:MAG: hypothetical protein RIE73_25165 [Coleofasciculus sp. C1-SOL-03]|uniref:hypothetical protein n=1 Tax=Coleofasciculus sp. C1-SOL-03 TaxID=3069522 RepID=UPI0032F8E216